MSTTQEFSSKVSGSGGLALVLIPLLLIIFGAATFLIPNIFIQTVTGILTLFSLISLAGFYTLEPNESSVITFFGNYKGTDKTTGLRWIPPFHGYDKISLKTSNFTSEKLKINDKMGNPIEFSAIVSWKVQSTSQAKFDVDSYEEFTEIQSEAGLRDTVTLYPYDHAGEDNDSEEITLRGNAKEVSAKLKTEVQERVSEAGIEIVDVRISHLAYATEIAQSMLQRQQATALIAARQTVVNGSIGIVKSALEKIKTENIADFSEKDKTAFVSNMLLVLAGDTNAQPVINTQQSSN
jgi:regulator of protease activity HflC (stomatin/prohibitin superfamily)